MLDEKTTFWGYQISVPFGEITPRLLGEDYKEDFRTMNGAPIVLFPIGLYLLEQPSQQLPSEESPDQYGESYSLPADTACQA